MREIAVASVAACSLLCLSCAPEKSARPVHEPPSYGDGSAVIEIPKSPSPPQIVDASAPSPTSIAATVVPDDQAQTRTCRCDVLGFESDGPPKSRCTLVLNPDGSGTLTGDTSSPKFSAKLTPIPRRAGREPGAAGYAFEGEFEFACKSAWCKAAKHTVFQVHEFDYRVTVERSADGPPSRVLWVTCSPP
jgi:hypothetical protein